MIDIGQAERVLRNYYPDLESVSEGVFRGIDRYNDREYAVRYFDVNDDLVRIAPEIKSYQERVLAGEYFSTQKATDLRWNYYLYFITGQPVESNVESSRARAAIEADREYARKQVIAQDELSSLLSSKQLAPVSETMPVDLASAWTQKLDAEDLGFVIDEGISVPDVVRKIISGTKEKSTRRVAPLPLVPAEAAASKKFIEEIEIQGFRPHPVQRQHLVGRVNLIVGTNGVGKTSLLEAIEFAYCGKNRRPSPQLSNTLVELSLNEESERLQSTSVPARLRARHANWYAKTELRTITIEDSFGKFNFLDTDAAVHLSVGKSSEQIGADVHRLVLGASAENVVDRIRRVLAKVLEELKESRRDKADLSNFKLEAAGRLAERAASPVFSDSLFLEVLESLRQLQWISPPSHKSEIVALREGLQRLTTATKVLLGLKSAYPPVHESNLDGDLKKTEAILETATALSDREKRTKFDLAQANRAVATAISHKEVIDGLLPYAIVAYQQALNDQQRLRNTIRSSSAALQIVQHSDIKGVVATFSGSTLTTSLARSQTEIDLAAQALREAEAVLQAAENTKSQLAVLEQRLRSVAKEIIAHSKESDHCPLCRTTLNPDELLSQISSPSKDNSAIDLAALQQKVEVQRKLFEDWKAMHRALSLLKNFAAGKEDVVTVTDALNLVENEQALLHEDQDALRSIDAKLASHTSAGLSPEDLQSKVISAGISQLPSAESLQQDLLTIRGTLEKQQEAVRDAQTKLEEIHNACERIAVELSIEPLQKAEDYVELLKNRSQVIESGIAARAVMNSVISAEAKVSLDVVASRLSTAQESVAKLTTSLAVEANMDSALKKETESLALTNEKLEAVSEKIDHLERVQRILVELTVEQSEGELTQRILAENAGEIGRIFSSIHMPNEFDLQCRDGRIHIIRRASGQPVELHQMSTGQRAAFALSLFLAMNERLRSGPPIILLDDPVAHVDDINVLSFLDHLRDIAIKGSRQIFFATADTKLAGLFRHKFRFLGTEFKELSLCRA